MNRQPDLTHGHDGVSRRGFTELGLIGSMLTTIVGVLTPIIGCVWPPAGIARSGGERVLAGTVDEFPH